MQKTLKVLVAVVLVMILAVGCKKPKEPENGGNNTPASPEFVDLGLPSGTLWATFNVGATTPSEAGYYFAWGETQQKSSYIWLNYKYCANGDSTKLTKYCYDAEYGNNGFVDNKKVLEPLDDVATAQWGNDWCTPTYEQWKELMQCDQEVTLQNGVTGTLFKGTNGKSIFMPRAGMYNHEGLVVSGTHGYYWSSTISEPSFIPLNGEDPAHALGCYQWTIICSMGDVERCNGLPVRPVRVKK